MEKRSCCCSGGDGAMNINMETGAEAAENAAAADAGTDDAVCHCRHKHRTEKEEKDLLKPFEPDRRTGPRHQSHGPGRALLPGYPGPGIGGAVCTEWLLQGPAVKSYQNLCGGRYPEWE